MKRLLCFLVPLLFLFADASGQQALNMSLLGTWDDGNLLSAGNRRYSDVWGYASNGREYALLGSREFVIILDVTDPANITEITRLNSIANSATTWRDIKVYGDHAYFMVDNNSMMEGLQVIDLSDLPNSASIVYQSADDFRTCHNLIVDTTSNPVRLYAFGTNTGAQRDGYMVFSLANPASPSLMASVNLRTGGFTGGYIHDGYAINDTLYANSEGRGMFVYDVSDPAVPIELGVLANYANIGYNHSNWRTADGKHVIMCDESNNRPVRIVDVEDPADMSIISTFQSQLRLPNISTHLAHNPYVLGDSLVVMSYYDDGVQVWDIKDRTNPQRLAYYDTTPGTNNPSEGVWGAYPFLPSGNILASDMRNGLFVVKVDNFAALPVSYSSWDATPNGKDALLRWSTSSESDNAGWEVEHATVAGQFTSVDFVTPNTDGAYTFTHDAPGTGTHYYRLRQRDFDGTEQFSDVKTVVFTEANTTLRAYPNPAAEGEMVSLSGIATDEDWRLLDIQGRLVMNGKGQQLHQALPAGVYLLKTADQILKLVVK